MHSSSGSHSCRAGQVKWREKQKSELQRMSFNFFHTHSPSGEVRERKWLCFNNALCVKNFETYPTLCISLIYFIFLSYIYYFYYLTTFLPTYVPTYLPTYHGLAIIINIIKMHSLLIRLILKKIVIKNLEHFPHFIHNFPFHFSTIRIVFVCDLLGYQMCVWGCTKWMNECKKHIINNIL